MVLEINGKISYLTIYKKTRLERHWPLNEMETTLDGVYVVVESPFVILLLRRLTDATSKGASVPCLISSSVRSSGTFLIVPCREVLKRGINAVSLLLFKIGFDNRLLAASFDWNWTSILEKPIF